MLLRPRRSMRQKPVTLSENASLVRSSSLPPAPVTSTLMVSPRPKQRWCRRHTASVGEEVSPPKTRVQLLLVKPSLSVGQHARRRTARARASRQSREEGPRQCLAARCPTAGGALPQLLRQGGALKERRERVWAMRAPGIRSRATGGMKRSTPHLATWGGSFAAKPCTGAQRACGRCCLPQSSPASCSRYAGAVLLDARTGGPSF